MDPEKQVLRHGPRRQNAGAKPVLWDVIQAAIEARGDWRARDIASGQRDVAARHGQGADQRLAEFPLPVARDSRDAEDLAAAQLERECRQQRRRMPQRHPQVVDAKQHIFRRADARP
jgi:hypothetical protein